MIRNYYQDSVIGGTRADFQNPRSGTTARRPKKVKAKNAKHVVAPARYGLTRAMMQRRKGGLLQRVKEDEDD